MKTEFEEIFNYLAFTNRLKNEIQNGFKKIYISPLAGSAKILFAKSIFSEKEKLVLLFPEIQNVNEAKVEFDILGLGDQTIALDNLRKESIQEKLTELSNKKKYILLATYSILNLRLPSKSEIEKNTTSLQAGSETEYEGLIEYLNLLNYQREKFVDTQGDYAVRGSIIDFWSYSEKQPCRLEFDGDFLESIRYFNVDSQRSLGNVESVTLAAAVDGEDSETYSDIFEFLNEPLVIASEFELQNLFKNEEPAAEELTEEAAADDMDEELKEELYDSEKQEVEPVHPHKEIINSKLEIEKVDDLYTKKAEWIIEDELGVYGNRLQLDLNEPPAINSNFELLFNIIKEYSAKQNQVIITVENELQAKRMNALLSDFREELAALIENGNVKILTLAINKGFISKKDKLVILSDYQIFNKPYRTKISSKAKTSKSRAKDFAKIKRGDFVVHENFGIGEYAGLQTIKIGQIEQESIKILYAEGGVVYVNLNYLGLVKKFSSKDNVKPKLSVLGSGEWRSTKKKVKSKIKEAARELIKLYAKRKASRGYNFNTDTIWQKELEASFYYEDTPDQSKISEEVKVDMESENPMDRLVCGDVGFGKTEIAVRAAFKASVDSKQTALLVPTTILAEQHYNTFQDRLSQFPVKVGVLSRFQTKSQQKVIVENLQQGKVDILIGTHRILSKDVKFKDLGLLIIDEEHRFGVMAKEKLRSIKANVDTLTLTATPIPRTLNLSLLGARDLSIMGTPPPNRQPIKTKVDVFNIQKIREWVLDEIKRDGQIYFVHDRVQSIEKIASYVQRHIPEVNIAVAHGQMKPSQLEKVIHDFLNKKFQILISTKIIESGLDIPNVNTIIVNRADRFGLAELHQLRGRVGRSNKRAYAYFIVPSLKTMTKKALKRLQAIEEFTEIGEGFNLSMRDLEIRGAGNLLGTEQSGAINSVGFDLYVKMLDEAVEELKREEFTETFKDLPKTKERSEPTVDTYFEIGIPKDFMPDQANRLSFYTALFSMRNIEEADELKEEIIDRFGKPPVEAERLFLTAILRFYASAALLERIVITKEKVVIILPKSEREEFYREDFPKLMSYIIDNYSKQIRFRQEKNVMKLEFNNKYKEPEEVIKSATKFVKEILDLLGKEIRSAVVEEEMA